MYSKLVFGRAGSEWPGYTATLNHKTTNFPGLLQDAFEQVEQNHIASIGTQAPEGLFGNRDIGLEYMITIYSASCSQTLY